ncbi:MAG: flavin reductase family protein [Dissulfurispiraceae bacterium]|jgi:flavin reductase (DIM6/NTAB) family NADH-FMN oxidoreductase RutF|nr:flavin reductase family protein [Dissulfurispiraceae bacterium]
MKKSFGSKTLVYPTPAWVVCTYDNAYKPNAMTIAWGGVCCSSPASVAVSVRKATYTHGNIMERKAFTVNIASERFVKEADYFGIVSGRDTDKFAATGLTAVKSDIVDAPYIKEFPMIIECRLVNVTELGLHTQFVGEIVDVKADESVLNEKGLPDIEKIKPLVYCPELRAYHVVGNFAGDAFSIGKAYKEQK